jgi:rubrerythrin
MKKYICTICGYIFDESEEGLWENLPKDWVCPICKADKSAFKVHEAGVNQEKQETNDITLDSNNDIRENETWEMAAICSNLAKGCEKQYLVEESKAFWEISNYFDKKSKVAKKSETENVIKRIIDDINLDIEEKFTRANTIVDKLGDRGAKRALVWSGKVTRMLKSIMSQYEKEGDSYIENTKIFVCEICGFISIGDELPKVCPVCKVPNFKMKEIGRE